MHVGSRLAAFLLVLLGTFGTAYAVGEKLPGHSHGHTHTHNTTLVPPGFSSGKYQLITGQLTIAADGSRTVHFRLETLAGKPVTTFDLVHGALLHLAVVRPDLSGFQHLHPTIEKDGSWEVSLKEPGQWHLVFEGTPSGSANPVIVSANLDDEKKVPTVALPAPKDDVTIDGLRVLRSGISFAITQADGTPAQGLEPYLGQPAHLIAIRQGDLAYAHLHPQLMNGMMMFGTTLPQSGTYRLFLQFGHDGKVLTVPFTVIQP
jgi:hypothetical protein